MTEVKKRFLKYVRVTGKCWLWSGSKSNGGYGVFTPKTGTSIGAHRFSFILYKGHIPDNLYVLHHCDIPACVNPEHLYAGTQQDNMDDRERRGRTIRGKGELCNGKRKLSAEQVRRIKDEFILKPYHGAYKHLAKKYRVTAPHISRIIRGLRW